MTQRTPFSGVQIDSQKIDVKQTGSKKSGSRFKRSAPRPLALEPRIMYDGAAVDTAAAAAAAAKQTADAATSTANDAHVAASIDLAKFVPVALEPAATAPRELVFVDARVPDYQQLVSGARSDVQVIVIQADEDGLQVIDNALVGRSDVTAIHVVTMVRMAHLP